MILQRVADSLPDSLADSAAASGAAAGMPDNRLLLVVSVVVVTSVVLFTAGGVATPADAAMMIQLGADGVFVGSGIFKSGNPAARAAAVVKATTFYDDPAVIAEVSRGLGEAMVGINVSDVPAPHRLAERGW